MTERIRIDGLDRLLKKLDKLGRMDYAKKAVKDAGDYVKSKIATYPPRPHFQYKVSSTWSAKQRRGFFARLRAGLIEVPYRRGQSPGSEDLGGSWNVQTRDGGLTAIIGTDTSYASLVQKEGTQTRMHKRTGWKTTATVVREETGYVVDEIKKALHTALK